MGEESDRVYGTTIIRAQAINLLSLMVGVHKNY